MEGGEGPGNRIFNTPIYSVRERGDAFKAEWKSTSYEELATKSKLMYVFECSI